jgi:hypothetical protein
MCIKLSVNPFINPYPVYNHATVFMTIFSSAIDLSFTHLFTFHVNVPGSGCGLQRAGLGICILWMQEFRLTWMIKVSWWDDAWRKATAGGNDSRTVQWLNSCNRQTKRTSSFVIALRLWRHAVVKFHRVVQWPKLFIAMFDVSVLPFASPPPVLLCSRGMCDYRLL